MAVVRTIGLHSIDYPELSEELSTKEWYVSIQGEKVCHQLKTTLDHSLRARHITQVWTTPQNYSGQQLPAHFTLEQVMSIDTDNIQKIRTMQRECIKRFLCKMAVDQLATG